MLDLSVLPGRDTMPTSPGQEEPKKAGCFQSLAHSVSLHCCGTKCEEVTHCSVNTFICSTAAWKDFSHLLWVGIAHQNLISGADL